MFTYSINCSQLSSKNIITRCSVLLPEIVMHDAYIGGLFLPTKITRKASNAAENLQLYRVVGFFHPRSSCMTHIPVDVQRITLNASSCITISGEWTEQVDIIAGYLPHRWLYERFSQFRSCGTYSVLSRSPSICFFTGLHHVPGRVHQWPSDHHWSDWTWSLLSRGNCRFNPVVKNSI